MVQKRCFKPFKWAKISHLLTVRFEGADPPPFPLMVSLTVKCPFFTPSLLAAGRKGSAWLPQAWREVFSISLLSQVPIDHYLGPILFITMEGTFLSISFHLITSSVDQLKSSKRHVFVPGKDSPPQTLASLLSGQKVDTRFKNTFKSKLVIAHQKVDTRF